MSRPLRDAREPRRADPADDHRADGHHRGDGAARAAHRRGAAAAPRVRRRRGDRRPQHALRLRVPRRRARRARTARGSRTGTSTRSRSRAGSSATTCRTCASRRSPATSACRPSPMHRAYADAAGDRRGAARAARARGRVRRARPRRPARAPDDARAPVGREARAHDPTPPRAGRLPLPRPRRTGALRRQGDEPARRASAPTSRPTTAARSRNCCARPRRSTTSCAAGRSRPRCARSASIQALQPRFNRQAKVWRRYAYLKLTAERFPRLTVTRSAQGRRRHLSRAAAVDARSRTSCGRRSSRRCRFAAAPAGCRAASSPTAVRRACPRSSASPPAPAAARSTMRATPRSSRPSGAGSTRSRGCLLDPLESRMHRLAEVERFEEAASTRDRLATLSRAIARQRLVDQLRGGAVDSSCDGPEGRLELRRGTTHARRRAGLRSRACRADAGRPPARARRDRRARSSPRAISARPRRRCDSSRPRAPTRRRCRSSRPTRWRGRARYRRCSRADQARAAMSGCAGRGRAPPGPRPDPPTPAGRAALRACRRSSRNTPTCTRTAVASAKNGSSRAIGRKRPQSASRNVSSSCDLVRTSNALAIAKVTSDPSGSAITHRSSRKINGGVSDSGSGVASGGAPSPGGGMSIPRSAVGVHAVGTPASQGRRAPGRSAASPRAGSVSAGA